jgi:exodeoxyribonuclease V gamma subunit
VAIDVVSALSADKILPILAERLSKPLDDPFAPDIVVVPGIGIADWIQEQLSLQFGSRGIVANTKFWLPNEFNSIVSASADHGVKMPDATALQWVVFEYLSQKAIEGVEPAPGFNLAKRKLSFAKRVAELFDRYAVHRPEMILDWNAGKDTDGASPLSDNQKWQPILWRELQSMISASAIESQSKPSSILEADWLRGRVTFFGLESFSRAKVQLLKEVRDHRDLQILHISPIDGVISKFRSEDFIVDERRRGNDLTTRVSNPLLRSWSRTTLECAALLSTVAGTAKSIPSIRTETVLGALQKSLAEDTVLISEDKPDDLLKQSDGSIQIHLCHGATRQVEVMRDALLHIMKSDPSIRPRDILVLCSDLEKYSPLIEPVMGAGLGPDRKRLPISIVEKSNVTATPTAVATDAVLALAAGRCSVLEVLEAISLEPIRLKFGFEEDELQAISGWVNQLNVKWGIDSQHRATWKYSTDFEDGTWQLAIDRLAAGMMIQSEKIEEHFPGVTAFDDVSGSDLETIGKLFAFYDALKALQKSAQDAHTSQEWAAILRDLLDDFIAVPREERQHLLDAFRTVSHLEAAATSAPTASFSLAEFRQYVSESLPSVRGGALKWADVVRVASPNRLRGVSARVIAYLGFDEDAFKGRNSGGDDILASDPRIGERDLRADERLGLLTTIQSASEYLVVTCNGHDVNKNTEIPLAVPMEEFKDAIALAISTIPQDRRQNKPVLVNHSRQLADRANVALSPDSSEKNVQRLIGDGQAWTFDHAAVGVVEQIANPSASDGEIINDLILPPPAEKEIRSEITINELFEAIRRPVDVFVNQRLGVMLPGEENGIDDEFPLWPDGLAYSQIGRELVNAIRSGETAESWKKRKHLSGGLPLGALAKEVWVKVEGEVSAMIAAGAEALTQKPTQVPVSLTIDDQELTSVGQGKLRVRDIISTHGHIILEVNYATWSRRMRVLPWLQMAALTLHNPDVKWQAVIVAKAPKVDSKAKEPAPQALFALEEFEIVGETPEERSAAAQRVLDFGNAIRNRARIVPLPLFERSSWIIDKSATDQKAELGYDLQRPSHALIFADQDLDDFKSDPLIEGIDTDLPVSSSRYEAYAMLLSTLWKETVRVTKEAEPPKKRGAGAKGKTKKSVENEEVEVDG